MKKIPTFICLAFAMVSAAFCMICADTVKSAVYRGVERCLYVLIPSLFAMLAVSELLIRCGISERSGKILDPVSRRIFGINGEAFVIFVFSQISGYPVGARLLTMAADNGRITRKEADILSTVCFGSGAAFVFGCAADNRQLGWLMLLSAFAANVIMLLLLSPFLRRCRTEIKPVSRENITGAELMASVTSAGRSMFVICCCTLIFSVFSEMFRFTGVIAAVLDITALEDLSGVGIPIITGLLSFGGICVLFQIAAMNGKLPIIKIAGVRIFAAVISYGICRMILPFFLSDDAVSAFSVNMVMTRHTSPLPSVILLIMTVYLFRENKAST